MFKLVDFLSSNNQKGTRTERKKKSKKKGKDSVKKTEKTKSGKLVFTPSEKEEIKQTVRTLNRESSRILTSKFREFDLQELARDLEIDTILPSFDDTPSNSETFSVNEDTSEEYSTGTFNVKDIKNASKHAVMEDDDSSYSSGTFCIKDFKSNDDDSSSGYNSGTFCMKNIGNDDDDDEEDYGGTFCVRRGGSGNDSDKPSFMATRAHTDPTFNSQSNTAVEGSTPDFSQMFREPENWEKHILALEKGEWTQGMEQNGAFKRWKKERPAMPSIYLRASNGDE